MRIRYCGGRGFNSMAMKRNRAKRNWAKTDPRRATDRKAITWLAAASLLLAVTAFVQDVRAQEDRPPQQAPQQQSKSEPGFFESIGRWFENGFSKFKNSMKDAKGGIDNLGDKAATAGKNIGDKAAEVGKNAADATKGAVDAVAKLPKTRVVNGRERCDVSPNGAPDCRVAAHTICSAKGLAGGTSMDFVSAEKCPAALWMNRRKPEPGECVTETFVTRAMCEPLTSAQ
jgi:hypothetical protein